MLFQMFLPKRKIFLGFQSLPSKDFICIWVAADVGDGGWNHTGGGRAGGLLPIPLKPPRSNREAH